MVVQSLVNVGIEGPAECPSLLPFPSAQASYPMEELSVSPVDFFVRATANKVEALFRF